MVGTNGAGKSTSLKLISRIILPTSGDVRVNGRVTALLELGAGFHPDLNGRDNIMLNGAVMGMGRREMRKKIDAIIDFADIGDFIDVPVKDYSSGMQARLGFAVAVHLDPEVVLIDEALSVGDQAFQQKCTEQLLAMRKRGVTSLLVSHSLDTVQQTCQRAIWIEHGKVRMDGPAQKVASGYYRAALESVNRHDAGHQNTLHKPGRPGSGEARIIRTELLDADGVPCTVVATNAPVTVRLHYSATEAVPDPAIGLGLINLTWNVHVAGPNTTMARMRMAPLIGDGWVDYTIDRLPLLPGEYQLIASIYDYDLVHCYDYNDEAGQFGVIPGDSAETHGVIALNGQWSRDDG